MAYEIDGAFLKKYDEIYGTLFTNYTRISDKAGLNSLEEDLNTVAFQAYMDKTKTSSAEDDVNKNGDVSDVAEAINNCSQTDEFKVFKFIVLAGLSSFYGLSYLNEYVNTGNSFGYDNSFVGLKKLCRMTRKSGTDFEQASLDRLCSIQRSCSKSEYFEKKYYVDDINLVDKLLRGSVKVDIDEELNEAIVLTFLDTIKNEVLSIVSVYKELLAASFGLKKYEGVFTLDRTTPVIGLTNSYRYKVIEPKRVFAEKYIPVLKGLLETVTPAEGVLGKSYTDRQFDHSAIYEGSIAHADKPLYFPHKMLELMSLGDWTTTKANVYKGCVNNESKNLNSYCELLSKNFEDDLFIFCAYACKADYAKLRKEVQDKWSLYDVITSYDYDGKIDFEQTIKARLRYYSKCVTTCIVLTEMETEEKEERGVKLRNILSFRIKVSGSNSLISNEEFCQQLSYKLYNNAATMCDIESTIESSTSIGVFIRDYAYTFDAEKVYARPIFAYKALTALQEQGMQVEWNNMLLGKFADGSICRSAKGEKIHLQNRQLHNIYAGSRSGKGVMCFNIFATAIASRVPIFYVDRKPDTAVILKSLAPGMFAVNGGQYDSTIDLEVQFNPQNINFRIPTYLQGAFVDDTVKNDYIYFRAMMLIFCLIIFMDKTQNKNDPRFQKISSNLSNGAVFVFDEFTNFVNMFLSTVPTTQNWFKECYSKSGIESWKTIMSDIRDKEIDLQTKQSSGKEDQIYKAQSKLEAATDKAKEYNLEKLYFAELADDYRDVVKTVSELYRAGGAFVKQAQVFIIGQDIPSEFYDGDEFFKSSNGASVKRFNSSTHPAGTSTKPDIPMVRMLNNMSGDYILGYQPPGIGKPKYLAQTNKKMISASMLTASRRCFCYYDPGVPLSYKETEAIKDTAAYFGGRESEMASFLKNKFTYFKPFLILNNAVVPPQELLYPEGGVLTPELENKRQAKGEFVQYKASQYVGQCLTSCNKAGLTWDDLYNDNKDENGNFHQGVGFEGYITQLCGSVPTDSMSLSGDIMTVFVNEVFGYKDGNWLDFLADFRPEAMFKPSDFLNAVDNPSEYSVQSRLSNSFFCEALTRQSGGVSFASVFAEELGTLAAYYGCVEDSDKHNDTGVSGITFEMGEDEPDFSEAEVQSNLRDVEDMGDIDIPDNPSSYTSESAEPTGNFEVDQHNRRQAHRIGSSIDTSVMENSMNKMTEAMVRAEFLACFNNILAKHPDWKSFWSDSLRDMLIDNCVSAYIAG